MEMSDRFLKISRPPPRLTAGGIILVTTVVRVSVNLVKKIGEDLDRVFNEQNILRIRG